MIFFSYLSNGWRNRCPKWFCDWVGNVRFGVRSFCLKAPGISSAPPFGPRLTWEGTELTRVWGRLGLGFWAGTLCVRHLARLLRAFVLPPALLHVEGGRTLAVVGRDPPASPLTSTWPCTCSDNVLTFLIYRITHGGALATMIDTTFFMMAYFSANAVFRGTMTNTFKRSVSLLCVGWKQDVIRSFHVLWWEI